MTARLYAIYFFVRNCRRIVLNESGQHRRALLTAYIWLKLHQLVQRPKGRVSFLDYVVHFSNYDTLIFLIEEIFIARCYYFVSRQTAPVIFDCGGNIGIATLYFKWIYSNARIVVFEPDPTAFALLKENIERNRLTNVTLVDQALLDRDGEIELYYDPQSPASVLTSVVASRSPQAVRTVKATRLSHYFDPPAYVDFVKLDVEGAEGLVVSDLDGSGTLAYVREMAIEENHDAAQTTYNLSDMLHALERNGFRYQISAGKLWSGGHVLEGQDLLIRAFRQDGTA